MESKRLSHAPGQSSEFVANMEQVLDTYKLAYDQDVPVVCMDESPKQMIEEVSSMPMQQGREARLDYEYIRHDMVSIFMTNEPPKGLSK